MRSIALGRLLKSTPRLQRRSIISPVSSLPSSLQRNTADGPPVISERWTCLKHKATTDSDIFLPSFRVALRSNSILAFKNAGYRDIDDGPCGCGDDTRDDDRDGGDGGDGAVDDDDDDEEEEEEEEEESSDINA